MRRITIIGNLTADANVKDVSGKKAINFAVATNEKYRDSSGNSVEKSFYYNCTIWRDSNVRIAEFLTKGTKVFIEGTPDVEVYKDRSGEIKGAIKIVVGNIELIGGGTRREVQSQISTSQEAADEFDDLPF